LFAAGAVANAIVVRIYEAGHLSDVGLGWSGSSLREFGSGVGLGAGGAAVILGGALAGGLAGFVPAEASEHPWAAVAFTSVLLLFGAMGEEMVFRGYAFQLLIRVAGPFYTIVPTSILFGLAHLLNPNPNVLGIANTMLWGCLLGYAYWRTQALWLPIGLHFGWNVVLPLFGVNLSGLTIGVTGYALEWRVGDLWSGGDYGVEGSVLTTLIVAVLFIALRRVVPPAA
jgi:membrane protease YdiL (CAAX protease family)